MSTDADVLVRTEQVTSFLAELTGLGCWQDDHFVTGSPFGHSVSLSHPDWGHLDVHRFYPGFGVEAHVAFDILWAGRGTQPMAGVDCTVPEPAASILIRLLHVARGPGPGDTASSWASLSAATRERVRELAYRLDAELPLAIALGEPIERFRPRRDFDLWLAVSHGSSRGAEWRARIKAESDPLRKAALAGRVFLPNPDSLAARLGHRPNSRELAVESIARLRRGLRDEWAHRRSGSR